MIEPHGLVPTVTLRAQLLEKLGRVGDIRFRIESLIERFEGVGVVGKVDLHAADVDVADAAMTQRFDGPDGRVPGRVEFAFAFRRDGPGPGNVCLKGFVPTAGFHGGDGLEQALGNSATAFFCLYRFRA